MADNKPTLHHLNVGSPPGFLHNTSNIAQNSQSQRILWLLEELEIPYNLILHTRNPPNHPTAPFRSPPSLTSIGPYGTSPLLKTGAADGNRYVAESAAIATYLIRTFDTTDKFGLRNGDWIRDEVLCSIDATSLSRTCGIMLMYDFMAIKNGDGPMGKAGVMDGPELKKWLCHLTRELEEGPPGGFFMGERPGRADIILEFRLSCCKHRHWWVNLEKEFPVLNEWLERVYSRPAWKRGLKKGNGYDLDTFPNGRAGKL